MRDLSRIERAWKFISGNPPIPPVLMASSMTPLGDGGYMFIKYSAIKEEDHVFHDIIQFVIDRNDKLAGGVALKEVYVDRAPPNSNMSALFTVDELEKYVAELEGFDSFEQLLKNYPNS